MKPQSDENAIVHVVDDDASMREAVQSLCHSIGIEARTYATARDFLTTAVSDAPGCIVIDIRLPDMNGLDFQAQLTQTGVRLPAVVMTGFGDLLLSVGSVDRRVGKAGCRMGTYRWSTQKLNIKKI